MPSPMYRLLEKLTKEIAIATDNAVLLMDNNNRILYITDETKNEINNNDFDWIKEYIIENESKNVFQKQFNNYNILTIPVNEYKIVILQQINKSELDSRLKANLSKALSYIAQVTGGEAVIFDRNGNRIASADNEGNEIKERLICSSIARQAMEKMEPLIGPSVFDNNHIAVRIPISNDFGIGFSNYNVAYYDKKKNGITINDIKGNNDTILQCKKNAQRMAKCDASVIVYGETGTGKEFFVNAIHNESQRGKHPFIAVNCGAIPENLAETIFFGYEGGAYTGSKKDGDKGIFENASGGSVFLDEISEMPPIIQVKLLRAIQEREIMRVGATKKIPINVRVIAASNIDLWSLCEKNQFRKDLYYRLAVLELKLPPLRERIDDIELLTNHIIQDVCSKAKLQLKTVSSDALTYLKRYDWPGNIRELRNVIERAIYMNDGNEITSIDLPTKIVNTDKDKTLDIHIAKNEKEILEAALNQYNFDKAAVSKYLGISQTTLWRRIKKYDLDKIE